MESLNIFAFIWRCAKERKHSWLPSLWTRHFGRNLTARNHRLKYAVHRASIIVTYESIMLTTRTQNISLTLRYDATGTVTMRIQIRYLIGNLVIHV